MAILRKCGDPFEKSGGEGIRRGEHNKNDFGFDDLQIIIGSNTYEARFLGIGQDGFQYALTRDGEVIYRTSAHFTTYDPNQNLWFIDGKLVWELGGWQPVIVVDGVNTNDQYGLEGSYFPYEIRGKLIYVAKKNGKYSIVYDGKNIGPEFDKISMAYCCAMFPLVRGDGYWFVGSRSGITYLISIR